MFNTSPIEHSPAKPRKLRLQSGQPVFRSLDIDPRARNVEAEVDDVLRPGLAVKCQLDVGGGRRGKTSGDRTCQWNMFILDACVHPKMMNIPLSAFYFPEVSAIWFVADGSSIFTQMQASHLSYIQKLWEPWGSKRQSQPKYQTISVVWFSVDGVNLFQTFTQRGLWSEVHIIR